MSAVVNRVHERVRVETPVEHAFEFACSVDRQREWNPYLELFRVSGPLSAVGTHFEAVFDLIGQSTSYEGTVAEATAPSLLHLHLSTEHNHADWQFRFEPVDGATMLMIDVDYEKEGLTAGIVDRFVYHAALERAIRHVAENFAAIAPTRTPILR